VLHIVAHAESKGDLEGVSISRKQLEDILHKIGRLNTRLYHREKLRRAAGKNSAPGYFVGSLSRCHLFRSQGLYLWVDGNGDIERLLLYHHKG
jgi:hypothetical protein